MVEKIASRKAAWSLTKIFVLMLLPVALFGFFYFREASRNIRFIEKETHGLELVNIAGPLLITGSRDALDKNTKRIQVLENVLTPGNKQPGLLILTANQPGFRTENAALGDNLRSYIGFILTKSNLILDADAETYHLIASVLQNLPEVYTRKKEIIERLESNLQTRWRDSAETREMLRLAGNLDEALKRMSDSFDHASKTSDDTDFYNQAGEELKHMRVHVAELIALLVNGQGTSGELAMRLYLVQSKTENHFQEDAIELWTAAVARIDARLNSRVIELKRQNLFVSIAGIVSALIAIGAAILMFRNTLVKLDDVENANKIEKSARHDLERMNADIAVLNQDLSSNMQRLQAAQDELVKKGRMEQLGQLTATIAHELRNPLGSVRTSTFLIERKLKGKGMGVEAQLDRINKGIVRCDNIITQLLDYSRTKQISAKAENLDQWLARVVEEAAKQIPTAVHIECVLGLDDLAVPFDASRLERAVINLLNNASEAMVGQGDDPTKFATTKPKLVVHTRQRDGMIAITVSDNGPGISPENLAKVREPLFTTKSFGTGLGIPAIEQIAQQHGGTLDIVSELGAGAHFTICIPTKELNEAA